jgi:hypothetical protein
VRICAPASLPGPLPDHSGITHSAETIDVLAAESLDRLKGSWVPQFVPLFVGRFTRERIKQILTTSQTD